MTPSKSRYKPEYHRRRKYNLDKLRTWIRLSPDELRQVAKAFAEKLNKSTGPTLMLIPLRGWSSLDVPGSPTFDPDEDKVFIEELQDLLKPEIQMSLIDANMEDPEFAIAVAKAAQDLFNR
jgi:uncharacterized protein (UPF0261 family)